MADRPRIRDVATLAGTSVSTVSNLLNGRPDRMRPETVQRIEAAISQLGYRPSWTARHLKTGFVPMLGLLVPSVANPSHGAMARAVEVAAEERGLQVVLGNSLRDPERERRYGSEFLDLGIRGMIVGSSPLTLDHFADLMDRGLTLVAFDSDCDTERRRPRHRQRQRRQSQCRLPRHPAPDRPWSPPDRLRLRRNRDLLAQGAPSRLSGRPRRGGYSARPEPALREPCRLRLRRHQRRRAWPCRRA